jgi:ATP-dependent RNA helicase HelY
VASVFVYETRLKEPPPPVLPNGVVRDAVEAVLEAWREVVAREEAAGLPLTRVPDAGFAAQIWQWAAGVDLDDVLAGSDLTAGDFVRNAKQVADVLRQIRDATSGPLSDTAHQASKQLIRGVVAYTGL